MLSEAWGIALLTALVNASVTWGVISVKLAWLRRDVDDVTARLRHLESTHMRRMEDETTAALRASKTINEIHAR